MEGILIMPPDRGTIIGRALWKPRYVVVGGSQRDQALSALKGVPSNRSSTPRELSRVPSEGIFLSIYKSKEDNEPVQQHAIATITECQVSMVAHRKQGPVLPTLVVNIVPDPATDKLRKRRSSRTAGLTATKESGPTTLFFRQGDEQHTLQEWARFIQQLVQPNIPERGPLSPLTPASPTFINPFAPRSRDPSDMQTRPGSQHASARPGFLPKPAGQPYSSRERPMTYSDSPSLRSKRSDLSSQTSSINPIHVGYANYTMIHPTDLPSPATTVGEYQGEFIEGWTSAQGRSSTLSSPVRERETSVSSQPPTSIPPLLEAGSPPGPRETILDRAFQRRCIPGSETEVAGEEKLSSLARFDALMREVDEKRKKREAEEAAAVALAGAASPASASAGAGNAGLKSAWDLDDSSDSDSDSREFDDEDYSDSDGPVGEMDREIEDRFSEPPTSRRAEFFESRNQRQQPPVQAQGSKPVLSYNHDALMALSSSSSSHARPQTGYSKTRSRPGMAQRTHSQPQLAGIIALSPSSAHAPMPLPSPTTTFSGGSIGKQVAQDELPDLGAPTKAAMATQRGSVEKRRSNSSVKRLSFSEITKRLSSTSSLLLVQGNASAGSSRGSSNSNDVETAQQQHQPGQGPPQHFHHLHPRAAPQPPVYQQQQQPRSPVADRDQEAWEKRCGWRGSVGVFGSVEGGFL